MDQKFVLKNSLFIFMILFVICVIVSIVLHNISYAIGLLLGYSINVLGFKFIQLETDLILNLSLGKGSGVVAFLLFVLKYAFYALGFFMAIKLPNLFSIITVFFGYFVIKLSIFYSGYRTRKG